MRLAIDNCSHKSKGWKTGINYPRKSGIRVSLKARIGFHLDGNPLEALSCNKSAYERNSSYQTADKSRNDKADESDYNYTCGRRKRPFEISCKRSENNHVHKISPVARLRRGTDYAIIKPPFRRKLSDNEKERDCRGRNAERTIFKAHLQPDRRAVGLVHRVRGASRNEKIKPARHYRHADDKKRNRERQCFCP